MPKIKCDCGNIISLGEIPSPNQFLIISDVDFDKYWDTTDTEELYKEMKIVAKCNNCQRMHFFWDGFDKPPTTYSKE